MQCWRQQMVFWRDLCIETATLEQALSHLTWVIFKIDLFILQMMLFNKILKIMGSLKMRISWVSMIFRDIWTLITLRNLFSLWEIYFLRWSVLSRIVSEQCTIKLIPKEIKMLLKFLAMILWLTKTSKFILSKPTQTLVLKFAVPYLLGWYQSFSITVSDWQLIQFTNLSLYLRKSAGC